MISLMMFFVEREMDDKAREEFRFALENPPKTVKTIKNPTDKKFVPTQKQRWRAPPGWTPPGWNEERSYANAQAFMGFNSNPK